mgnify:CR=1 FL=1
MGRAKLHKQLRQAARKLTVGKPGRRYVGIAGRGKHRGEIVAIGVDPKSTRGVYHKLKKSTKSK